MRVALRVPPDTAAKAGPGAHDVHFTIERTGLAADDLGRETL